MYSFLNRISTYVYTRFTRIKYGVTAVSVVCLNAVFISSILATITPLTTFQWYSGIITVVLGVAYLYRKPETVRYIGGDPIISVCSYCGKIKQSTEDPGEYTWIDAEEFICGSSEYLLSHGICRVCCEEQLRIFRGRKDFGGDNG